jgi:predicted molibdopterin-dependent oxidoreductase YjgC
LVAWAEIYLRDGKVVKVEGDQDHPYHQGRLCPRALALRQYIHHPDRLHYPLKRSARTSKGEQPSCVKHCQASTMVYGDVTELAKIMEEKPHCVLLTPR